MSSFECARGHRLSKGDVQRAGQRWRCPECGIAVPKYTLIGTE